MLNAWWINRLMRLGRTLPDLPADTLFEVDEWRGASILNKKPIPAPGRSGSALGRCRSLSKECATKTNGAGVNCV